MYLGVYIYIYILVYTHTNRKLPSSTLPVRQQSTADRCRARRFHEDQRTLADFFHPLRFIYLLLFLFLYSHHTYVHNTRIAR